MIYKILSANMLYIISIIYIINYFSKRLMLLKIKHINKSNHSNLLTNAIDNYNNNINNINKIYNTVKYCKGYRNAIIVLLMVKEINQFIDNNIIFLKKKFYDVLIFFVTENITFKKNVYKGILYSIYDVTNYFTSFPYGFNDKDTIPNFRKRGKWNYQHMCRFFFRDIFIHPALCSIKYFMRLDSQSYLNTSLNLFPLKNSSIVYVHNVVLPDVYYVVKGLKEFTLSFIHTFHIKIQDDIRYKQMFKYTVMTYNNNLEIGDMMFFRNYQVFQFINLVDLSYGQFIYRWGDAPLRYVCLTLFASHNTIIPFPDDIIYYHKPFLIYGNKFTYNFNYSIKL